VGASKDAARNLKRAQILLAADAGAGDEEIARSVGVGGSPCNPRAFPYVGGEAIEYRRRGVPGGSVSCQSAKEPPFVSVANSVAMRVPEASKYPPAKPGALISEPLKAALRGR